MNQLVAAVNKLIVGNANEYVFARTDVQKPFISKHMGSLSDPSFIDRLVKSIEANLSDVTDVLNDEVKSKFEDP